MSPTWVITLLLWGMLPCLMPPFRPPAGPLVLTQHLQKSRMRRRFLLQMIKMFRIPKVEGYWRVTGLMDDIDFYRHFRMRRSTYEILVRVTLPPPHAKVRLPPPKEMLVFLWWIANTECYRAVADRFGISKSTAHVVVERILKSIRLLLRDVVIQWPTGAARDRAARRFKAICGLPNAIGAVDGCHIQIIPPTDYPDSYYNRNKYHSVNLMAVCDADLNFTHINVGFPGRAHDARVFLHTSIGNELEERYGDNFYILGDSAFTLTKWLMPPYKGITPDMAIATHFNTIHSKGRVVIENIYAAIYSKWRKLHHLETIRLDLILHTIEAACCLHNFVQLHEGPMQELPDDPNDGAIVLQVPQDKDAYRNWLAANY